MLGGSTTCKVLGGSVARLGNIQEKFQSTATATVVSITADSTRLGDARLAVDALLETTSAPRALDGEAIRTHTLPSKQGTTGIVGSAPQAVTLARGAAQVIETEPDDADESKEEASVEPDEIDQSNMEPEEEDVFEANSEKSSPVDYIRVPNAKRSVFQEMGPVEASVHELHARFEAKDVHTSSLGITSWNVNIVTKGKINHLNLKAKH